MESVIKKAFWVISLIIVLIPNGFCSSKTIGEKKIKVAATIFPLADIAKQVGGEKVKVITILPAGASPHTFEPTPRQVKDVSDTELFLEIGAGLEFWADKIIESGRSPHRKTVVASEGVQLLKSGDNDHPGGNPHIWLDPILAKGITEKIEKALINIDPAGTDYYRKRAANYRREIDRLDTEIRKTVSGFRVKKYVAFHPSWTYFGIRYGLKEVGVIEKTPGREPTPKQVKLIIDNIKKSGIRAVFAEPQFSPKIAETIAENTGAKVLLLDPLGGPEILEKQTYLALMRYNLKIMKKAME